MGRKKVVLSSTFSPSMLGEKGCAEVYEVPEISAKQIVRAASERGDLVPNVGHENTAALLEARWIIDEPLFSREKVKLQPGDVLVAAIPQFRPPESREFNDEEVRNARFRFFVVEVE